MQSEGLLKEVSFAFEAEDGVLGVGTFGSNEADSRSNFYFGGVEILAVGAIEGVGNSEDPREKVEMVFLSFRQVLVSAVCGGGGTFSVVPGQEGDELGF